MYLVYAGESGDVGHRPRSSRYFALSGLVVHELSWHVTLDSIVQFRQELRQRYGLKLREEIHAGHFLAMYEGKGVFALLLGFGPSRAAEMWQ